MPEINWLAVTAAALASLVIGGIWYSPLLFAQPWQRAAGVSDEALKSGNPWLIYGGAFALSFVAAAVFALFLGPRPAFAFAVGAGLSAGLCWVAASFGINYLFERRSLRLFLINGGYHALQFTAIGALLGLWH